MVRSADRRRARDEGDPLWASVLDAVDQAERRDSAREASGKLCLNWGDPTVRALAEVSDEIVVQRVVKLVMVIALLTGHHPVEGRDRNDLTEALGELLSLSVGLTGRGGLEPEDFA